jgi:hypothetical protein
MSAIVEHAVAYLALPEAIDIDEGHSHSKEAEREDVVGKLNIGAVGKLQRHYLRDVTLRYSPFGGLSVAREDIAERKLLSNKLSLDSRIVDGAKRSHVARRRVVGNMPQLKPLTIGIDNTWRYAV